MDVWKLQEIGRNVIQYTTWIVLFLYFIWIFAYFNFVLRKCSALQCHLNELIEITHYYQKTVEM